MLVQDIKNNLRMVQKSIERSTRLVQMLATFCLSLHMVSKTVDASTSLFHLNNNSNCDYLTRAKYCKTSECLRCDIGPACPVQGPRVLPANNPQGTPLLREIDNNFMASLLSLLDESRKYSPFSGSCPPIFQWDSALASAAQAWADQCALVQYEQERKENYFYAGASSSSTKQVNLPKDKKVSYEASKGSGRSKSPTQQVYNLNGREITKPKPTNEQVQDLGVQDILSSSLESHIKPRSPSRQMRKPKSLMTDTPAARLAAVEGRSFRADPGVAQSVHWARTTSLSPGLNRKVLKELISSEIKVFDGFFDGIYEKNATILRWGHATHVGCGWIQFPTNLNEDYFGEEKSMKEDNVNDEDELIKDETKEYEREYENFLVCNYGIGENLRTICDEENEDLFNNKEQNEIANEATNGETQPQEQQQQHHEQQQQPLVTYYSATSDVIRDVKKCLSVIRCASSNNGDGSSSISPGSINSNNSNSNKKNPRNSNNNNNCDNSDHFVTSCLSARSGLRFFPMSSLRLMAARANQEGEKIS